MIPQFVPRLMTTYNVPPPYLVPDSHHVPSSRFHPLLPLHHRNVLALSLDIFSRRSNFQLSFWETWCHSTSGFMQELIRRWHTSGLYLRPPCVTSGPSVESYQRSRAQLWHPQTEEPSQDGQPAAPEPLVPSSLSLSPPHFSRIPTPDLLPIPPLFLILASNHDLFPLLVATYDPSPRSVTTRSEYCCARYPDRPIVLPAYHSWSRRRRSRSPVPHPGIVLLELAITSSTILQSISFLGAPDHPPLSSDPTINVQESDAITTTNTFEGSTLHAILNGERSINSTCAHQKIVDTKLVHPECLDPVLCIPPAPSSRLPSLL